MIITGSAGSAVLASPLTGVLDSSSIFSMVAASAAAFSGAAAAAVEAAAAASFFGDVDVMSTERLLCRRPMAVSLSLCRSGWLSLALFALQVRPLLRRRRAPLSLSLSLSRRRTALQRASPVRSQKENVNDVVVVGRPASKSTNKPTGKRFFFRAFFSTVTR